MSAVPIIKGITTLLGFGANAYSAVKGNQSQRDSQAHKEAESAREQFAKEFQASGERTWIDTWNRMPRPMLATMVILSGPAALFMIFHYPVQYTLLIKSLPIIPLGVWSLYGTIIGFYFFGRMQAKKSDFAVSAQAMKLFTDALAASKAPPKKATSKAKPQKHTATKATKPKQKKRTPTKAATYKSNVRKSTLIRNSNR